MDIKPLFNAATKFMDETRQFHKKNASQILEFGTGIMASIGVGAMISPSNMAWVGLSAALMANLGYSCQCSPKSSEPKKQLNSKRVGKGFAYSILPVLAIATTNLKQDEQTLVKTHEDDQSQTIVITKNNEYNDTQLNLDL